MLRRTTMVRSFFGAAVLAALGFGASELRATQQSCNYAPWQGELGYCINWDNDECSSRCQREIPGSPGGFCGFGAPGGCCICAY